MNTRNTFEGQAVRNESVMTKAGGEFLENWIQKNVTADNRYGGGIVALTLADKCREAAAVLGIDIDSQVPELEKLICMWMKTPKTAELWEVRATVENEIRPLHPSFDP